MCDMYILVKTTSCLHKHVGAKFRYLWISKLLRNGYELWGYVRLTDLDIEVGGGDTVRENLSFRIEIA